MKLAYLSTFLILQWSQSFAFAPNKGMARVKPPATPPKSISLPNKRSSSELRMSIPAVINAIQRPKMAACALGFLLIAVKMIRDPLAFFWPGATIDKKCDANLPDGSMGCPFIGEIAKTS